MTGSERAIAAVRAVTGRTAEPLRLEGRTMVMGDAGMGWVVSSAALPGFELGGQPDVLIVSPLRTDDPDAAVWVADLPGRDLLPLTDEAAVGTLLGACPGLPADTIARLIAINLGPRGAERVLLEDAEIESLLAELAPAVPVRDRGLSFRPDGSGGWSLGFLSALLRQSDVDRTFRLTVARWSVRFAARSIAWDRREILTDALLERYRA